MAILYFEIGIGNDDVLFWNRHKVLLRLEPEEMWSFLGVCRAFDVSTLV
jgi:hypothetical protein